jgi:uncharacterized protein (TIGR03435 family)
MASAITRRSAWVLAASLCVAQSSTPSFEVASVKAAPPGETGGRIQFLPGGRLVVANVALRYIIQSVYEIRDFQIVGDPRWMALIADGNSARYYIDAKGDESASEARVREMAKTLLAERFQLKAHKETRDLSVYALIPAKGGIKLTRTADNGKRAPGRGGITALTKGWIQGTNVAMALLVQVLSQEMKDRPVVDETNFTEPFDFRLTWAADSAAPDAASDSGCPASFAALQERLPAQLKQKREHPAIGEMSCPSIFTAVQEQLGLKLEPRKEAVEVLVIDYVERPSAN